MAELEPELGEHQIRPDQDRKFKCGIVKVSWLQSFSLSRELSLLIITTISLSDPEMPKLCRSDSFDQIKPKYFQIIIVVEWELFNYLSSPNLNNNS